MKKSCIFVFTNLLLFLFPEITPAQSPMWENFTYGSHILCMAEDGNYVWAGSTGGISKIDKTSGDIQYYNRGNSKIPDNYILSVCVGKDGKKWFGTNGFGLVSLDGETWRVYKSSATGLNNNTIRSIVEESSGILWLATDSGLTQFNSANFINYTTKNSKLPSRTINSITIDNDNNKWLGTDQGVAKLKDTNWTIYNTVNSKLPTDEINDIAIDNAGICWIASNLGLIECKNSGWVIYNTSNSGLPGPIITKIKIKADMKWIYCNGFTSGLIKYDNTTWTVYNSTNSGMPVGAVNALLIDMNGNKWLGGFRTMVHVFDDTNWVIHNTNNSLLKSNSVLGIDINQRTNEKWIADYGDGTINSGGLIRLSVTNWTSYKTHGSAKWVKIENDSTIWAGLWSGIGKLVGSKWTFYTMQNSGMPTNDIFCIDIDHTGYKWFGTFGGGLLRFDGSDWVIWNMSNSAIPSNSLTSIAVDTGNNIWIGTQREGLAKFDGTNWTTYNTSNSTLANDYIQTLKIDLNGKILIGHGKGFSEFNGITFINYDASNSSLPSDNVLSIAVDKENNRWIGFQNSGMIKYNGITSTNFTMANSNIPKNDIRVIEIDTFNNVWIGTANGGMAMYNKLGLPLGINTISTNDKTNPVLVYPNPFSTTVTIEFPSTFEPCVFEMYDINGGMAKKRVIEEPKIIINRDELRDGLYFYRILSANGNILNWGKLYIK